MPPTNPAIFSAPPGSTVQIQGGYEAGARFGAGSQAGVIPVSFSVCLFFLLHYLPLGDFYGHLEQVRVIRLINQEFDIKKGSNHK